MNTATPYELITFTEAFQRDLHHGGVTDRIDADGVRRAYHQETQTFWVVPPDEPPFLPLDGQQASGLFRSLSLSSCQAEPDAVVWYFQAGIVLRLVDGDNKFRLTVAPSRAQAPTREELFTSG